MYTRNTPLTDGLLKRHETKQNDSYIGPGLLYIGIHGERLLELNTYYFGKMKFNEKNPEQKEWAKSINLIFTNQDNRGNHINVAGGGVVKYSKNKDNAIALLEFLTQPEAQVLYSKMNYEYPVNPNVEPSEELSSWGVFIEDQLPVERLAELAPTAQKIIDRVGW